MNTDNDIFKNRWKYFNHLLNEENPRIILGDRVSIERITPEISQTEAKEALKKMKNGKACGPDEIPAEAWKSLGEGGINRERAREIERERKIKRRSKKRKKIIDS